MVTRSNAWWMTKTKGIYIFSASPFRQRAFAGFGREMTNMIRQHWSGALYFGSLSFGAWYLMQWAGTYYQNSTRKDPAYFEEEYRQQSASAPLDSISSASASDGDGEQ